MFSHFNPKYKHMQAHTGFATGELGYRYETTLCESFANSLHFVNVLAQRYKCASQHPNPGLTVPCSSTLQPRML